MRLYTYTLRIEAPDDGSGEPARLHPAALDAFRGSLQDAEDVVNDALPEGYYCKVDGPTGVGVDLEAVERLERAARRFEQPFPTDEDRQALIEALQPRKGKR